VPFRASKPAQGGVVVVRELVLQEDEASLVREDQMAHRDTFGQKHRRHRHLGRLRRPESPPAHDFPAHHGGIQGQKTPR